MSLWIIDIVNQILRNNCENRCYLPLPYVYCARCTVTATEFCRLIYCQFEKTCVAQALLSLWLTLKIFVTEILSQTIKIDWQIDIHVKNSNVGLEIYKTCSTANVSWITTTDEIPWPWLYKQFWKINQYMTTLFYLNFGLT
jgi:hypothetical protein